jgi:hypothetical protein
MRRIKCPEAQFLVPDWGDKIGSGVGLSYRPVRLHRLAWRYDNPMPESTLSPAQSTVDRVLGFFSSRPHWDPPAPSLYPQASVSAPLWFRGDTLACGRGGGGVPIRTRGQTLWHSIGTTIYVICVSQYKGL